LQLPPLRAASAYSTMRARLIFELLQTARNLAATQRGRIQRQSRGAWVVTTAKFVARSPGKRCIKGKKNKVQGDEKHIKDIRLQDGSGTHSSEENLLETYECQLKILHAVLTASGDQERDQLLKDHPGDICTLVHSIIEK
ncbi:hypothetical protein cypCar_00024235, partial [Cyprinus carpio]